MVVNDMEGKKKTKRKKKNYMETSKPKSSMRAGFEPATLVICAVRTLTPRRCELAASPLRSRLTFNSLTISLYDLIRLLAGL